MGCMLEKPVLYNITILQFSHEPLGLVPKITSRKGLSQSQDVDYDVTCLCFYDDKQFFKVWINSRPDQGP